MTITLTDLKNGVNKYARNEFVNSMQGFKALAFGAGIRLAIDEMADQYFNNYKDILIKIGAVQNDGLIDIDKLYLYLSEEFEYKGKIVQVLPFIGETTFTPKDLEKIYEYCKGDKTI